MSGFLSDYAHRGLVAVHVKPAGGVGLPGWSQRMGLAADCITQLDAPCSSWAWNLEPSAEAGCFVLGKGVRRGDRDLLPGEVAGIMEHAASSSELSSPFGAIAPTSTGIRVAVDRLGFRQLYSRVTREFVAVSTSARALARLTAGSGLDQSAIALQSHLGWQLGAQTLFADVAVVPGPGLVGPDGFVAASVEDESPHPRPPDPVTTAASLLRQIMSDYLDEHPQAELQLTGGLDSRIILAAIPEQRRRGLRAMTLETPGSSDALIAAQLSAMFGVEHRVKRFTALDHLEPAEAFELCRTAARRVDGAADPIALAAVELAEGTLDDSPRIEGLGGEVARGFYYLGPTRRGRVTDRRIRNLTDWRLFANEAVPSQVLHPTFRAWAEESARRQVADILRSESASDWVTAVDGLYLHQRMRRWAGALASATCLERPKFNPMLDPRFLGLVATLRPAEKQNAVFLARIVQQLDPRLAAFPMDGRPSPATIAAPSPSSRVRMAAGKIPKALRKARQRLIGGGHPPEGGQTLAGLVAAHLRSNDRAIDTLAATDLVDPKWLSAFVQGQAAASPAACSLLVTLLALGPQDGVARQAPTAFRVWSQ